MLVCKIGLSEKFAYRKIRGIILQKKIFHIDDSNDIVCRVFVYGHACKHILTEYFKYLLIGGIRLHKGHINTGNHDFLGLGIAKIEQVMNHIPFLVFDDPAFLTDIHDGTEFFLCYILFGILNIDP